MQPTAVFVPLEQLLRPEHFPVVTTELFGPFQVGAEPRRPVLPLVVNIAILAGPVVDVHLQYLQTTCGLKLPELSILNEPQALCACLSGGWHSNALAVSALGGLTKPYHPQERI